MTGVLHCSATHTLAPTGLAMTPKAVSCTASPTCAMWAEFGALPFTSFTFITSLLDYCCRTPKSPVLQNMENKLWESKESSSSSTLQFSIFVSFSHTALESSLIPLPGGPDPVSWERRKAQKRKVGPKLQGTPWPMGRTRVWPSNSNLWFWPGLQWHEVHGCWSSNVLLALSVGNAIHSTMKPIFIPHGTISKDLSTLACSYISLRFPVRNASHGTDFMMIEFQWILLDLSRSADATSSDSIPRWKGEPVIMQGHPLIKQRLALFAKHFGSGSVF